MTEFSLQKLIELVQFDQAMLEIERDLQKLHIELESSQRETTLCQEGMDKFNDLVWSLKKEVDAQELEMKTLDQEEKEKRKRLDESTNQREYDSFSKEVELLKKKQHELEEGLLATWKKYEHAQEEHKNRQLFCQQKLISLDTVIKETMQRMARLESRLAEQRVGREEKLKSIPADLLEKYAAMYKQVANPVVPIEKNSCSACFYPLTQQRLLDARHGKLLQCTDCFRFLYAKETSEEPTFS